MTDMTIVDFSTMMECRRHATTDAIINRCRVSLIKTTASVKSAPMRVLHQWLADYWQQSLADTTELWPSSVLMYALRLQSGVSLWSNVLQYIDADIRINIHNTEAMTTIESKICKDIATVDGFTLIWHFLIKTNLLRVILAKGRKRHTKSGVDCFVG